MRNNRPSDPDEVDDITVGTWIIVTFIAIALIYGFAESAYKHRKLEVLHHNDIYSQIGSRNTNIH